MGARDFASQRNALVDRLARREDLSKPVEEAMRSVPREEFVPDSRRSDAYADRPLPIGEGQTVSAPHMVAMMAEELGVGVGDRVLEIGTGCGYHAAVTAELVGASNVFSVEYVRSLALATERRLARLGYGEIRLRQGDGHAGWPENAPYDAAYLTCAAGSFPDAVIDQVRVGGTLLGPLGSGSQWLVRAEKRPDGSLDRERLSRVRFVPMQGEA
jgi:protein-L-isoaspartate(D-aspartate) O-methyltransferase